MSTAAHCMPLSLAPGAVLRIDRGARIGLRAAAGLVWLTERGSPSDRVLRPGDSVSLTRAGRALVAASSPARIVLEIPHDLAATPRLELADREGAPGRELPLPAGARGRVARLRELASSLAGALFAPRTPAAGPLGGQAPEGALAIKLRSLRREDRWLRSAGGIDPLVTRDNAYPYF
jgi:hypothetical protein